MEELTLVHIKKNKCWGYFSTLQLVLMLVNSILYAYVVSKWVEISNAVSVQVSHIDQAHDRYFYRVLPRPEASRSPGHHRLLRLPEGLVVGAAGGAAPARARADGLLAGGGGGLLQALLELPGPKEELAVTEKKGLANKRAVMST